MKIGISAEQANNPIKTGVEHYAQQLILQLAEIDTEDEFILYLRAEPEEWIKKLPKNFTYKVMPFPALWNQIRLSLELLLNPVDVFFAPASGLPLLSPKNNVATVHDAAFLFYPETFTWFLRNYLHWTYKYIAWRTGRIIVPSRATRNDLIKYYRIAPERITVVHHGYTPIEKFEILNSKSEIANKLPEKFVLYLSTLQPRKNLEGLIEAFQMLKREHPDLPHKLVVAGKPGWKTEKILETIERNKNTVVYLNHVTNFDRSLLYQRASALCVPSFYEGFGMWVLEAFDAGVPMITSNVSSLPEVGGDAAEYCDPHDMESIKKAMERVLLNPSHAGELVVRGRKRLEHFSWSACAERTLQVLKAS